MSPLDEEHVPLSSVGIAATQSKIPSQYIFEIPLLGRFLKGTEDEYPCRLKSITPKTATILSPFPLITGEKIVCFIDRVGIVEGVVERCFEDGFVLGISLTPHGRSTLVSRLKKISEAGNFFQTFRSPKEKFVTFTTHGDAPTPSASFIQGRLQDLSLFGAFLITQDRPALGSEIYLRNIRCRVEEHDQDGIFFTFIDLKRSKAFRRHFLGQPSTF